jgi:hypothetical protein
MVLYLNPKPKQITPNRKYPKNTFLGLKITQSSVLKGKKLSRSLKRMKI